LTNALGANGNAILSLSVLSAYQRNALIGPTARE
jgi:hypothetical protein